MSTKLNIRELTFGSDDAELDEKHGLLDKVFLKTTIYHRVRKANRELVIGRKGTGKSAICLMLKNALDSEEISTILATPDSLSQQKIERLKTSSINKDESYVLSWKYMLLVIIAKNILSHQVAKIETRKAKKKSKIIRNFLVSNDEIDKNFFDKLFRKASALSKFSIKAYGVEGSVETQQLELQNDAANELDKFQKTLSELLAELNQIKIVLLIDKVDDIWNQTEESEMMIIGLLKAVHALNASLHNTHILIFLRSDIYDILKFNDSDKFHSLEEKIEWQENDLKHLIATRGKVSANLQQSDVDTLWDTIFSNQVNHKPSFEYMVKRTLKRPRDLIQFCNSALTEAQDRNHTSILEKDILSAEKQYSNWKLKDLASEFRVQYPYLDELLGLFQAFKAEFTREEFDVRFQESKPRLKKYPDLQTASTEKVLQILYIIGFLGTQIDDEAIFVYDDPLILLSQEKTVIVHPAFHLALGLQKISAGEGGVIGSSAGGNIISGDVNVVGDIAGRDVIISKRYQPEESSRREITALFDELQMLMKEQQQIEIKIAKLGGESFAPTHLLNQLRDVEAQIAGKRHTIQRLEEYLQSR